MAGVDAILEFIASGAQGLIFANLVDFDMLYGHRNDPRGFANALEEFDRRVPELDAAMGAGDVLMVTADHGNDPTTPSTDHSRERVPFLVSGPPVRAGVSLGTRGSFADVAATIAELLGVAWAGAGESFARTIVD
jgi:phosphopentomutase